MFFVDEVLDGGCGVPPPEGGRWIASEFAAVASRVLRFKSAHPQHKTQVLRLRATAVVPRVSFCPSTRGTSSEYRHQQALWILLTIRPWSGDIKTGLLSPEEYWEFFFRGKTLQEIVLDWETSLAADISACPAGVSDTPAALVAREARVQKMYLRNYRAYVRCQEEADADRVRRAEEQLAARAGGDGELPASASVEQSPETLGAAQHDGDGSDVEGSVVDFDDCERRHAALLEVRAQVVEATRSVQTKCLADAMPTGKPCSAQATNTKNAAARYDARSWTAFE
jgi:hypothetical protein